MPRVFAILLLALALLLCAIPAFAGGVTDHLKINWIKSYPTGTLFSLDGFTLADVDPATCADPGSPNFWLPATSPAYESLLAVLLTAHAGDRTVKIRYNACSNYSSTSPMLDVWMFHVD